MKEILFSVLRYQLYVTNISESDKLEDLGADSLDAVSAKIELEAQLEIDLPGEKFTAKHTVGEWLKELELRAKPEATINWPDGVER